MTAGNTGDEAPPAERAFAGFWLGRRSYAPIHDLMQQLHESRRQDQCTDLVLLLEHDPVITLGRGAKLDHILADPARLLELGVSVVATGRGGDVTLHGPGQLIAYPIMALSPDRRDVRKYVQALTRIMNRVIVPCGLQGGTLKELIGLWVDLESPAEWPGEEASERPAKIGAIGVRISRWVTTHGFALNLSTELSLFNLIVPCGIQGRGVTSLERAGGARLAVHQAARHAHSAFCEEFSAKDSPFTDLSEAPSDQLNALIGSLAAPSAVLARLRAAGGGVE